MEFLLSNEYLQALLSPAAQASLTEKLVIVAIVWATMGRKVTKRFKGIEDQVANTLEMFKKHLTEIEAKFTAGIEELRDMKQTVSQDLRVNAERLSRLEDTQQLLIKRVEKLEN